MDPETDYGRRALDFIEAIERHSTVDKVMDMMAREFARFGFETVILSGLPNQQENVVPMVLAHRWPAEWFKLYARNQYIRVDPVPRHCRRSVNPFEWSEAPYDSEKEPRAAEVMWRAMH
jgi:LuxR family transcriptional regulator, quorum-sensing system regulator BjaR1